MCGEMGLSWGFSGAGVRGGSGELGGGGRGVSGGGAGCGCTEGCPKVRSWPVSEFADTLRR